MRDARRVWSRREVLAALAAGGLTPRILRAADAPAAAGDVPWLADAQQAPDKPAADTPVLQPLLVDAQGQPITTLDGWLKRRAEIRRWWVDFLGPMASEHPQRPKYEVPKVEVLEQERLEGVIRERIRYEVEPEQPTEAYLLRPAPQASDKPMRRPGVVVFHPTVDRSIREPAGLEGRPERSFGLELARRGCVALCPRNYLWPETDKLAAEAEARSFAERHPDSKGMAKMLLDGVVALDILAALGDVDPARLGTIGHSLGAKEVLYLAAFDGRVRAAVSSEGGIGTGYSNWDAPWYLGPTIRDPDFGHEHHELLALAAPCPFLLVGGDSADGARSWPFVAAAMPVYELYAGRDPGGRARLGLWNHHAGHAVTPDSSERMIQWLLTYLAPGRA